MLRAGGIRRDERQIDGSGGRAGEFDLCLFCSFLQTLSRDTVLTQVNPVLLLEAFCNPVDHTLVEVIAAKTGIAVGGKHFEHAIADIQNGNIESTAAQVIHQDLLVAFLIQTIRQRSGRRFIDDTLDIQACDTARILSCLTLAVIEVCRHGNHCFGDFFAQIAFSGFLHLGQDHGTDILRCVFLAINTNLICRTHFTLDGNHRTVRIRHSLTLCHLADQTFAILRKSNNRRGCTAAFRICNHNRLSAFHDGYTAVCSTKVNTNNLCHKAFLLNQSSCIQKSRLIFNVKSICTSVSRQPQP